MPMTPLSKDMGVGSRGRDAGQDPLLFAVLTIVSSSRGPEPQRGKSARKGCGKSLIQCRVTAPWASRLAR